MVTRPLHQKLWFYPARFGRCLYEIGRGIVREGRGFNREAMLQAMYRALLGRDVDPVGKREYLPRLRNVLWGIVYIFWAIQKSHEFAHRWHFELHPLESTHRARKLLIERYLPPADVIVDLGGASESHPEGALLLMGYPYTPKSITIVDLPPGERIWRIAEDAQTYTTTAGTEIRYLYQSMADLSPIPDGSVDLVYSGESIEHVSPADARRTIAEAWRVLKPGGYFCLDTPNRALTRLHSPHDLIHPEHKKEYVVHELVEMVEQQGFVVEEAKAVQPLPDSLRTGVFSWEEMLDNIRIGDDPEEGYLFYLKCRRDA